MTRLPTREELEAAAELVYAALPPTPQYRWPLLDARCGAEVWVKHENHLPTGAFKVRGGLVYMAHLRAAHPDLPGVVAATRGNHGQSVGYAARRYGVPATVVAPVGNSVEKNAAMRALGVELIECGHDFQEALEVARALAASRGWHYFPSYDRMIVAGVATYGLELMRAVPELETIYVGIGQGSGILGLVAAREALGRSTEIVGVVSASAPAYALSLVANRLISHEVSTRVADGLACRTPNADSLSLIAGRIKRIVQVSDDAVEAGMRALFHDTHNVAEGAGAAALAAVLGEPDVVRGRRVAVVLSGGNVDTPDFARILADQRG
jgi:threonine dehydratase